VHCGLPWKSPKCNTLPSLILDLRSLFLEFPAQGGTSDFGLCMNSSPVIETIDWLSPSSSVIAASFLLSHASTIPTECLMTAGCGFSILSSSS
jgi:hypothetical protein